MKRILILIAGIVIIASCTKTKTNTVTNTVTKYDTTYDTATVTYVPTLLGKWVSATGVSPIVFDTATYTVQSNPSIAYIASPYTIYDISETNIVYVQWTYSISTTNDTLWLTTTGGSTSLYTRN